MSTRDRLVLIAIAIVAGACAVQDKAGERGAESVGPTVTITGILAFRLGTTPSPGSVAKVTISDFSAAEEAVPPLAASMIELDAQGVMIPFKISAPKSILDTTRQYVVQASVENAAGEVTWTSAVSQLIDPGALQSDVGVLLLVPTR